MFSIITLRRILQFTNCSRWVCKGYFFKGCYFFSNNATESLIKGLKLAHCACRQNTSLIIATVVKGDKILCKKIFFSSLLFFFFFHNSSILWLYHFTISGNALMKRVPWPKWKVFFLPMCALFPWMPTRLTNLIIFLGFLLSAENIIQRKVACCKQLILVYPNMRRKPFILALWS